MSTSPSTSKLLPGLTLVKAGSQTESSLEVASQLGEVQRIPGLPAVQALTPRESTGEEKSNYSGNFGLGAFPMHTDLAHWYLPPRFFLLRCIQPSPGVTTEFVEAGKIIDRYDELDLKRAVFRPRRRLDKRLSVLRLRQGRVFRWDPLFLRPMNRVADEIQSRIAVRLEKAPKVSIALESSGDYMIVDNWRLIHGRSSIPASEVSRKIERVYLSKLKSEYE